MERVKVLFIASNPKNTGRIQLDEEIRLIDQKIGLSEHRDSLELISVWAVRAEDLLQALNTHKPSIVHFSGHGDESGKILLVGSDGEAKQVSIEAMKALFSALKDNISIVVLNACYTSIQAEALSEIVNYVIGMNSLIGDEAAIIFSSSFYRAIGFGRSVPESFEQGKVALLLEGIEEDSVPELFIKKDFDAGKNPVNISPVIGNTTEKSVIILSPEDGENIFLSPSESVPAIRQIKGEITGFKPSEIEKYKLIIEVSIKTDKWYPQGKTQVHVNGSWLLRMAHFGGMDHIIKAVLKGKQGEICSRQITVTLIQ